MPTKEYLETLSLQDASRIPYIIAGDITCFIGFTGLFLGLIFQKLILEAVFIFASIILFLFSLISIKRNKLNIGSSLTTIGLLLSCIIVLFFGKFVETTFVVYRNAFFVVVMALANQLISLRKKQIIFFMTGSGILWVIDWLTVLRPFYSYGGEIIGAAIINNFAIIVSFAVIILINQFNENLVKKVEQNELNSKKALEKMTAIFSESKNGLNVGKRLTESAEKATSSISQIKELSQYLINESTKLSTDAETVKNSGIQIVNQSEKMKDSVHEQTSSLTETSAAMTQISGNIASINKIANAQHSGMDEIVKSLDAQRSLLNDLVNQVSQVRESSEHITAFVNTIDNISSQTSLLAMNASIEAAHAGTFGKGFSVIAQEIRKLSDETTKSAAKISETLNQNAEIVASTTDSVNSFAVYTEKNATVLRTTLQAIEEILSGISEMNTGTQEVMKALQNIVDDSQTGTDLVTNVVAEISAQKTALEQISSFSDALKKRAAGLGEVLNIIEGAITNIQEQAEENIIVGKKISDSVNI